MAKVKKLNQAFSNIPDGSILGLNYSGVHDSAIAVVSPDGTPLFAVSLERISRVKQDGRPPVGLLENIPWERIAKVAVSAPEQYIQPDNIESKLHPAKLHKPRQKALIHGTAFLTFLESIPSEKVFVGHQEAHAASVYWGSSFNEALCLTYDGGMSNDPWFGGLYQCSRMKGIQPLDRFSAMHYAKMTSLYTFVTALLGFTPNKHEGKITGLAAYGNPTEHCKALMTKWFEQDYFEMEESMRWIFGYDEVSPPQLIVSHARLKRFQEESSGISREDMAATVQNLAENHILEILSNAHSHGWHSRNICLAGGLFANVKINQRVVESGFEKLFVAPSMTDDGTALGAAWHVVSSSMNFAPKPLVSMFLGPFYDAEAVRHLLEKEKISYTIPINSAETIASLLADGSVVVLFQGAMEFGPRALGNRSILAQATEFDINRSLNERLGRTEFMPFAPMTLLEDADECYIGIDKLRHTAEFMTVTVDCTASMRQSCPAVVHVDGTARPQLVSRNSNPFVHEILSRYKQLTRRLAIVNTSFNIHEEPIVCSPEDAIQGFFEAGLDYLYVEGVGLIPFAGNEMIAIKYLQQKLRKPSPKSMLLATAYLQLDEESEVRKIQVGEKEIVIQKKQEALLLLTKSLKEKEMALLQLTKSLKEKETVIHAHYNTALQLTKSLKEKEVVIRELSNVLSVYRSASPVLGPFTKTVKKMFLSSRRFKHRVQTVFAFRLGRLTQYAPKDLSLPEHYTQTIPMSSPPQISIVTPSFQQSRFIERTIKSVLNQNYPNLEYFIQDGGSSDGTDKILSQYSNRVTGWESRSDGGQSEAINLGFLKTSGEIMAWLNSDDILLPGALAYVARYFQCHPKVDVVYGHRIMIDENDQQIGRWMMPAHDDRVLSWSDYIPQETLFWRRSIWEKAGGTIDETFCFAMDWDLLVRFREAGARFVRLPRFLGGFRIHTQQKTSVEITGIGIQEMNRIRQRLLGKVPSEAEIYEAVLPYMRKHLATDLWWRIRNGLGFPT